MAYSADSPSYKLNFTDGSFLTILNSNYVYTDSDGEFDFIFPNVLWSVFDGFLAPMTKYDTKGNKYDFYSDGVVINDTGDYRNAQNLGRLICFKFDPINDELSIHWNTPLDGELPRISDSGEFINAWLYRGMCGPTFSSIGEMIAKGQRYRNTMRWGTYGAYDIRNILYRTSNTPFNSVTRFVGSRASEVTPALVAINDLRFPSGGSRTVSLDHLDELLEDFDPINPIPDSEDPFEPGGTTGKEGGDGDFDGDSDSIDIPGLPSLSASDTGFITLFNPSLSQLRDLASYMWTGLFDVNNFKKIFADPMDCILGLSIVPVNVPNGGSKAVKVGNISTGVYMTVAASQYVEIDCGSINVNEYWGAYLDYEPFTKCEIYLPYIGTHVISTDDVMKKTVSIKYHVDILSGACTAYVKCGNSVLYEFIGQCASSIPICGNDWTNVINGVITIAGAIGTMVATGGAAAPTSAGAAATAATHKQLTMIHEGSTIASAAVNSLKPSVEKSGAMAGTGGMMGIQKPYIILTRPRQALPRSQNYFTGYPSFITEILGSLSGFTIVEEIHLEGISGTNEEAVEIENLLRLGVIF